MRILCDIVRGISNDLKRVIVVQMVTEYLFTNSITMKTAACIALLFIAQLACAQTTAASSDSLYIVTYSLGELWDQSKSPGEQQYFKEHGARLGQLRKEGVIRFGARYSDKGMIVIAAPTFVKAKEIITADVAVQNKLFTVDVQRLNIFYDGCLERRK